MIFASGVMLCIVGWFWSHIFGKPVYRVYGQVIGGNNHDTFGGILIVIGLVTILVSLGMLAWRFLP